MLNRYLGNKNKLLPDILSVVGEYAKPGARVGDFFAGSMVVSLALKAEGYDVVSNDINLFSTTFGKAYIVNNKIPKVQIHELIPDSAYRECRSKATKWVSTLRGQDGFLFLESASQRRRYIDLLAVFVFLETASEREVQPGWRRSDIYDTYCTLGRNSHFESSRGTKGNRRFFSPENAFQIDTILGLILYWLKDQLINDVLYRVLVSSLIRAVEKVSNTQGTYHDFPREIYDSRSLSKLSFEAMPFDAVLSGGNHLVGNAEDSIEFALTTPPVDVLYLDPPYNFRQYTSYYFLPNLLAGYCEIPCLDEYFSEVQYVRGQNMGDDFDSTFCKKSKFIPSLETLICRSRANVVVLSYFNGRNHWNDFKSGCNGQGLDELTSLFNGELFVQNSLEIRPIQRLNYQSYGGCTAKTINEYLFIARVKKGEKIALA